MRHEPAERDGLFMQQIMVDGHEGQSVPRTNPAGTSFGTLLAQTMPRAQVIHAGQAEERTLLRTLEKERTPSWPSCSMRGVGESDGPSGRERDVLIAMSCSLASAETKAGDSDKNLAMLAYSDTMEGCVRRQGLDPLWCSAALQASLQPPESFNNRRSLHLFPELNSLHPTEELGFL